MKGICIDSSVTGTGRHLLIDDGFQWVGSVPSDAWHFTGTIKQDSEQCFDTAMLLDGKSVDHLPPRQFVLSTKGFTKVQHPPWQHIMPKSAHRVFIERLVNDLVGNLKSHSLGYYRRVWVPGQRLLHGLQPSSIDVGRWKSLMAQNAGNISALKSFEPKDGSFAPVPVYDRFKTRTGRLTITGGANILTMNREHRSVIGSAWDNGIVAYVDFAALEARIMLYEAGRRCEDIDMYEALNDELFDGKMTRDLVKRAVISELYGMSRQHLSEMTGLNDKQLVPFLNKIKLHFNVKELLNRTKDQFLEQGAIRNRYDRRIVIDEPLNHIFVNSYVQSTGVDVSLLGFHKFLETTLSGVRVRPLFVLHDALIIDVHPDDAHVLRDEWLTIDGYVQKFIVRVNQLSCT